MPTSHRAPGDRKHRLQPGGSDLRGSVPNVGPRQPRRHADFQSARARGSDEGARVTRIGASRKADPRSRGARLVRAARLVLLRRGSRRRTRRFAVCPRAVSCCRSRRATCGGKKSIGRPPGWKMQGRPPSRGRCYPSRNTIRELDRGGKAAGSVKRPRRTTRRWKAFRAGRSRGPVMGASGELV
jgi:hypothetical protein